MDQGKDPKKIFERMVNRKSSDSSSLEILIKTVKNLCLGRRVLQSMPQWYFWGIPYGLNKNHYFTDIFSIRKDPIGEREKGTREKGTKRGQIYF